MRNKKGFLLGEETLKIVVALICIIFLIYFLTSIYFSNATQKKRIEATNSIERISQIISDSTINEENYEIPNPSGWYLFSFISQVPNSCSNENCICICDKVYDIPLRDNVAAQFKECDTNGACKQVFGLNKFKAIKISSPPLTNILIKKENGVTIQ